MDVNESVLKSNHWHIKVIRWPNPNWDDRFSYKVVYKNTREVVNAYIDAKNNNQPRPIKIVHCSGEDQCPVNIWDDEYSTKS